MMIQFDRETLAVAKRFHRRDMLDKTMLVDIPFEHTTTEYQRKIMQKIVALHKPIKGLDCSSDKKIVTDFYID